MHLVRFVVIHVFLPSPKLALPWPSAWAPQGHTSGEQAWLGPCLDLPESDLSLSHHLAQNQTNERFNKEIRPSNISPSISFFVSRNLVVFSPRPMLHLVPWNINVRQVSLDSGWMTKTISSNRSYIVFELVPVESNLLLGPLIGA